jgi:hypothetical protein
VDPAGLSLPPAVKNKRGCKNKHAYASIESLRRIQMKFFLLTMILFLGVISLFPACGFLVDENSPKARLKNVDAIKAMAIANEWKWSKKDIKSYVNSREVVFEIAKGKVKKIPLPEERMLVAVAPYINRTHR